MMEIDGDDAVIDGSERVLCLGIEITSRDLMCAIVQDAKGDIFRFPSSEKSFVSMRRVNMSVEDFLAGCKLED